MKRLAILAVIAVMPAAASAFDRYAGLAETEHQTSDLSKALNLVMSTATPNLYFHTRELMVEDYEKAAVNKAIALNVKSGEYWQTTDQDSKVVTPDRALEGCQLRFGSPCRLLAVNDELVQAGPVTEQEMPRLKYSGGFDVNQLPIVKDEIRKRADVQGYLAAGRSKAIALNPIGQMFVVTGLANDKEAADMALARCDTASGRKKSDGICYLYSLNNDVIIGKRKTFPFTLTQ
jgi:hypothetical protein